MKISRDIKRGYLLLFVLPLLAFGETISKNSVPPVGRDLSAVFQRAREGAPLRYVALGGSITQAGEGWIGGWLKEKFPQSEVSAINSGMSATGSALGIFRVERDVIAYQPDLVAIEYCVNDGGLTDEEAIRYMESLVVRLRKLPHPPAILILEAAARDGVNLKRYREVAQHYNLLEVDLQAAVDAELKVSGRAWETLFSDAVHPNKEGHVFYAKVIEESLTPFLEAGGTDASSRLPPPLSAKPLLLDGRMVSLSGITAKAGWKLESSLPSWWNRFFNGVLSAGKPGTTMELPFRGTTVGLFFAMDRGFGTFYASVDGANPEQVFTNTRGGYSYKIFATDIAPQEHSICVALPPASAPALRQNGPVKLGFLLLAGETGASNLRGEQGDFSPDKLEPLDFRALKLEGLRWTGAYPLPDAEAHDAETFMEMPFPPEEKDAAEVQWNPLPATEDDVWDFRKLVATKAPGIVYVSASVDSSDSGTGLLILTVDYFARIWVNGKLAGKIGANHGSPDEPKQIPIELRKGKNDVLIKVGAGSDGHRLNFSIGTSGGGT
ncbi:lysophospholipase [Spartobacteria bacterium LR76]|nr:lysophospholipase [Spartobacteria bacterium LR76]